MKAIHKPFLSSFTMLITIAVLLSACMSPAVPSHAPTPSQTLLPAQHASTIVPTPTPRGPLTLGEAVWIGRGEIVDAEFIPEQKLLAVAWANGVSLFDLVSKNEKWYLEAPTNVIAFDAQPGGDHFAVALADGRVLVYAASDGSVEEFTDMLFETSWGEISWSPDGNYLAIQYINVESTPIYVLEPATGKVTSLPGSWLKTLVPPNLVWSPDGQTITVARAAEDNCPKVISIADGRQLFSLDNDGLCDVPLTLAYLSMPKSESVVLAAKGGAHLISLFNYPGGTPAGSLDDPAYNGTWEDQGIMLSAQGDRLLLLGSRPMFFYGANQPLSVWDVSTRERVFESPNDPAELNLLRRIAGGFVGDQILVLYENGQIMTWDYASAANEYSYYVRLTVDAVKPWVYRFSTDGQRIATGGQYGGIALWETASGSLIRRFDAPLVNPVLNPDGNQVSLFDEAGSRQLVVDVASGKAVWSFPADVLVGGAAFSPDGSRLAFNHGEKVGIANLADGKVQTLNAEDKSSIAGQQLAWLTWSPDGNAVAAAFVEAETGSIILWEGDAKGVYIDSFQVQHTQGFNTVPSYTHAVFSPGGKRLAIAESVATSDVVYDQTLVIYDRENHKVLQEIANFRPMTWVDENILLVIETQINIRLAQIDVSTGKMVFGSGGDYLNSSSAPGGKYFVLQDLPNRGIVIKDWQDGRVLVKASHQALNSLGVFWSLDGRWVASLGSDGSLKLWEVIGG